MCRAFYGIIQLVANSKRPNTRFDPGPERGNRSNIY